MRLQAGILTAIILVSVFITNQFSFFNPDNEKNITIKATETSARNYTDASMSNFLNNVDFEPSNNSIDNDLGSPYPIQDENKVENNASKEPKDLNIIEKNIPIMNNEVFGSCSIENNMPTANIFLAEDLRTGEIFFQKNISYRWPIASITKLMTAVIVMDKYDFSESAEIKQEIIDKVSPYNVFDAGEKYSINDLVRAAVVASSNDAAYTLANIIGEKEFIDEMNKRAKELGMTDTIFWEPSGLSYLNQSTANDLFKLIKYIYNNYPNLLATTRKENVYVTDIVKGIRHKLNNTDAFAGLNNFYGGKTGYIDESGQNLLTLFEKNGNIISIMVLGSEDRFGDVEKIYNCVE